MTLPDTDTIDTYGGELINYHQIVDPTTDRDADAMNQALASVAGMTHTAIRAWRTFVGHATTPTDPASNSHDSVWGNSAGVKPTCAHSATGVYTVTWTATQDDELGETHTLNLRRGWAQVEGATAYVCQVDFTAANVARVRVFDMAGAANDAVGANITVYAV